MFGINEKRLLRFDVAVFDDNNQIKCLIECQGEQHFYPVEEYGGKIQYQQQVLNDQKKQQYAACHKIKLISISYKDKKKETIEALLRSFEII